MKIPSYSIISPLMLTTSVLMTTPTFADDYSINLLGNNDESIKVGTLHTDAAENGSSSYKIKFDNDKFDDHFLSMRPFKCVPGSAKLWCHTPYPYEIKREFTDEDFTDLEYDVIFVWKPEGEYGINLWNGV